VKQKVLKIKYIFMAVLSLKIWVTRATNLYFSTSQIGS